MTRVIAIVLLVLALGVGGWLLYSHEPSTRTTQAPDRISPRNRPSSISSDSSNTTKPSPPRTVVASAPTTPATTNGNPREVPAAAAKVTQTTNGTPLGTPSAPTEPGKSDDDLISKWVSPTGRPDDEFDSNKVMHNHLSTEPRDDAWASQAEQQLRNYITAKMGPERLNLVSVHCGSSLCEVDAVGRSPENLSVDMKDWQEYLLLMRQQPWWQEYQFDQPRTMVASTPDNRALFIAFVTRLSQPDAG